MERARQRVLGASVLPALAGALLIAALGVQAKPNIVLIYADDLTFQTINALGNREVLTPTLDSLSRSGTAFTGAHLMGGLTGGLCAPSRAMVLTGRSMFRLQGSGTTIPAGHASFPQALEQAGYQTFAAGKWHNDKASFGRIFQKGSRIFLGGMTTQWDVPVQDYTRASGFTPATRVTGTHSSRLFADAALDLLRTREAGKPFLLYLPFTAPHDPREAPEAFRALYDTSRISLPPNFLPEHPFDNGDMAGRDELLAPTPRPSAYVKTQLKEYYAEISHLDAQVARVLGFLREQGLADSTLVVFAGDNGIALGQHGLLGKQNLYDHAMRVPLLMSGPGIPKGQRRAALCYLFDIFPTLADLIGVAPPAGVDGRSLVPLMRDPAKAHRPTLFFAYKDIQRAVRDAKFRLIEYHVKGVRTTQLFDMQSDPHEMKNLAGDPAYAGQLRRLQLELLAGKELWKDPSGFWNDYTPVPVGIAGMADGLLAAPPDRIRPRWERRDGSGTPRFPWPGTAEEAGLRDARGRN